MSHKNPWFLITSEEIAEIRRHLRVLEVEGSKNAGIVSAPLPKSSFSLKVAWYDRIHLKNTDMSGLTRQGWMRMKQHC